MKKGFTLAETLLVIVIIGVVAAMTIPNLIAKYEKQVTLSRLEKAYSAISQALMLARVEYGDPAGWEGLKDIPVFVEAYLVPNLKIVKNYGVITLGAAGYSIYYTQDGKTNTNLITMDIAPYIVELADGSALLFRNNQGGEILVYIDINGSAKPNIWGRDAFISMIEPKTGVFRFYKPGSCAVDGKDCGAEIMNAGWQIKDDYPIRF